jgi:hypothetical protein
VTCSGVGIGRVLLAAVSTDAQNFCSASEPPCLAARSVVYKLGLKCLAVGPMSLAGDNRDVRVVIALQVHGDLGRAEVLVLVLKNFESGSYGQISGYPPSSLVLPAQPTCADMLKGDDRSGEHFRRDGPPSRERAPFTGHVPSYE